MYFCVTTGTQAWLKKKITQSTSQYTINKDSFSPNSAEIIFFFKKKKSKQQPTVIFIQNANSPYFANKKEINA